MCTSFIKSPFIVHLSVLNKKVSIQHYKCVGSIITLTYCIMQKQLTKTGE